MVEDHKALSIYAEIENTDLSIIQSPKSVYNSKNHEK